MKKNSSFFSFITFLSAYLVSLNSTLYENCYENNMALIEIALRNSSDKKFVFYDSHCYPKIGYGLNKYAFFFS
jgi:hypothetical protein